ncbi:hypothetical protein ES704_00546 [subsurface metagenome]
MNKEYNGFTTTKFNRFSLIYYDNHKGRKPNESDCIAKINCYIEGQKPNEKYLKTIFTSPVLIIKFFKDGSDVPPNEIIYYEKEKNYSKGLIEKYGPIWKMNIHYPISQFNDIMSLLHYYEKKPLYFLLEKDSLKRGLSTTEEPVKEKTNW